MSAGLDNRARRQPMGYSERALQAREVARIASRESVLVVGAGRLGQLIARVLAPLGCDLRVPAKYQSQIRRLEEQGIETQSPQGVPKRHFDVVVEAAGSPSGLQTALSAVKPRGRIVLKSTYAQTAAPKADLAEEEERCETPRHETPDLDLSRIVVDEIQLLGSRCGPFAPALRLLESGRLDPSDLIEDVMEMKDVDQAFRRASQPGALKVLLRPS